MITGIILAGGKSSRMGTNKCMLIWKGKTLIEHAIDTLQPFCNRIIISSNKNIYGFTGCESLPDEIPLQAPIIGIYSCLKKTTTNLNLVISCDLPLIGPHFFEYLLKFSDNNPMVIPRFNSKIEPLCGIYNKGSLPCIEQFIDTNNFRLYECIITCNAKIIDINPQTPVYKPDMFLNINTTENYNKLLSLD